MHNDFREFIILVVALVVSKGALFIALIRPGKLRIFDEGVIVVQSLSKRLLVASTCIHVSRD